MMNKKSDIKYQYKNQQGLIYEKIERVEIASSQKEGVTIYWANPKQQKWVRNIEKLTCDLIPYNYMKVTSADEVIILSDEEEVDELQKAFDLVGCPSAPTCIPASVWKDDFALLIREKHVVIMLRRDDTLANFLATRLYDVSKSVKVVSLDYKNIYSPDIKNPGVHNWIFTMGGGSVQKLLKIIADTYPFDEDSKGLFLDSAFISIDKVLQEPEKFERPYVLERISQIHSKRLLGLALKGIAEAIGMTPEEAQEEIEGIKEKAETEEKITRQEEASELRLKGLVDIATDDQMRRVFLVLDEEGKLKSTPFVDGKNEEGKQVRFIPPHKISFLLPNASPVIELFNDEDPTLFVDLMEMSREYVELREIDRMIMVCTIFLSYVIHHQDIHYLPIILMVSPPSHGKSHVLKLIAITGFRGKWFRSLNLSACQRYNDEFHSVTALDLYDFQDSIKSQDHMDFVLGKIEKGATIPKVNRPSADRYKQSDEYDPYGLLVIGSNTAIPSRHEALLTRILPLNNIAASNKERIMKPDNPSDFIKFRNRLTAWKARMMTRKLADRGYIELEGRLYDMGQPFLQILNTAYPQGYDSMVAYLKDLERRKRAEKALSYEATILSIIKSLYTEEALSLLRQTGNRPDAVWMSQRRFIDNVLAVLPKLTNKAIMKICREKFNLHNVEKKTYDYLIEVEGKHLDRLLKTYGVEQEQQPAPVSPDPADERHSSPATEKTENVGMAETASTI